MLVCCNLARNKGGTHAGQAREMMEHHTVEWSLSVTSEVGHREHKREKSREPKRERQLGDISGMTTHLGSGSSFSPRFVDGTVPRRLASASEGPRGAGDTWGGG